MLGLIPLPYRILAAAVVVLLIFGAGFRTAWVWQDNAYRAAQLTASERARQDERKAAEVAFRAGQESAAAQERIRTVTKTIVKEVPVYVSREADSRCAVPVGALRVLDAAARGVPVAPPPAGQSDDTPSGVDLSAVVGAGAEDIGTCHAVRQQLIDLQAWIMEVRK